MQAEGEEIEISETTELAASNEVSLDIIEAPEQDYVEEDDIDHHFLGDGKIEVASLKPDENLKGVYLKIVSAAIRASKLSNEISLQASEHKIEAHKQNLLPQITPGASIDDENDTVAQLNIEQVLFDSGRYQANRDILVGERDSVAASLHEKQNKRAARAIAAYIDFHQAREKQKLLKQIISNFRKLENQSDKRLKNGVGSSSDKELFLIKKLEVEAEYENQEGIALSREQEFVVLTKMEMPSKSPSRMHVSTDINNSPALRSAMAERDSALGRLDLNKSNHNPLVRLVGNVGTASNISDEEDMDLRLDLSLSKPLNWGFNHGIAASHSEVVAADRKYDEVFKETQVRLKTLKFELQKAEAKLAKLERLSNSAHKRVKGFNRLFLSGQAGIVEASSIVESYKKIKTNMIDTRFEIYNIELEIGEIVGSFAKQDTL